MTITHAALANSLLVKEYRSTGKHYLRPNTPHTFAIRMDGLQDIVIDSMELTSDEVRLLDSGVVFDPSYVGSHREWEIAQLVR